jgi:hypothetical protein
VDVVAYVTGVTGTSGTSGTSGSSGSSGTTGTSGSSGITPVNQITGTGTTNTLPKFTGASTIGDSAITDDGTTVTLVSRALSGTSATFSTSLSGNAGFIATNTSATGYGGYIRGGVGTNYALYVTEYTGANTLMAVLGNGNVGIGTASPDSKLHIISDASAATNNYALRLQNTTTASDSRVGIAFLDNSNTGGSASGASIQVSNNGVDGTGNLLFGTLLNGTNTERMRITSGGNVLIGTTSDNGNKFQVSGTINASSTITSATSVAAGTTVTGPQGVNSVSNNNSIPFNTWTTIATVDSSTIAMYLVVIGLAAGGFTDWTATGILYSNGTTAAFTSGPTNGALVQLRISGTAIQVIQTGTSPSINLSFKLLKVA